MPRTQLPQSIPLPTATCVAAGAAVIPLYIIPLPDSLEFKIGIEVIVTPDGSGTAAPVLFEFDTGGKGFWASAQALAGDFSGCATHGLVYNQYHSGITYFGEATDVYVTLPASALPSGQSNPTVQATVGLVDRLYQLENGTEGLSTFPIFSYFFGDFGASLQPTTLNPPLTHEIPRVTPPNEITTLLTLMSQFPQTGGNGFIVDLVNTSEYTGTALPAGTTVGRLILGGADTLSSSFPIAMTLPQPGQYTSPATQQSCATYSAAVVSGTVMVKATTSREVDFVMDTGAPVTTLYPGTDLLPSLQPVADNPVMLIATGGQLLLDEIYCGSKVPIVWGKPSAGNPAGYVNTGLAPYFQYQVMFDLANGTVRFPPAGVL